MALSPPKLPTGGQKTVKEATFLVTWLYLRSCENQDGWLDDLLQKSGLGNKGRILKLVIEVGAKRMHRKQAQSQEGPRRP